MNLRAVSWILPVAIVAGMLVAGCSQDEQEGSGTEPTSEEGRAVTTVQKTATPETTTPEQGATTHKKSQGRVNRGQSPARKQVTLRLEGSEGTRFSGSCSVAGEERRIEGTVPETYTFELGQGALECEIRKQSPGNLRVIFNSDGSRSVQQVTGENVVLKLSYEDGRLSTSTRSVS